MATLREIKELKDRISKLYDPNNDPTYRALKAQQAELEKQIMQASNAYTQRVRDEISALQSDLAALQREKAIEENPFFGYSISLMSWFTRFLQGTDFGYGDVKLRWVSPNQNWAIITSEGTTAGTGTAMGTSSYYYASAKNYLVRVKEGTSFMNDGYRQHLIAHEHAGRLVKAVKAAWIAEALSKDEGCPFVQNADRTDYAGFRVGDYVRRTDNHQHGYVFKLSADSGKKRVAFLAAPTNRYGTSFELDQVTTMLELVKPVEDFNYENKFEPDDLNNG